ncbi:helix-turn-helix transcriptional regulator [Spirillospora sp. NPDC052269]
MQRAILISELQRLRIECGQAQDRVAAALDWSVSKLVRIEGGLVGVSATDLRALLRHYGLPPGDERVDVLIAIARDARQRGWWSLYQQELSPSRLRYIGYEFGAASIRAFRSTMIPGLLQTEEYANALTGQFVESPEEREVIVEVGVRRRDEILGRDDPPRLTMVVDEAVLRRRVGAPSDPGVMPRQLRHILDLLDRSLVSVRVIPFSAGAHSGMAGDFTILRFDDARLDDVLFQETVGGSTLTAVDRDARVSDHRDARVCDHRAVFERLQNGIALPAERTSAFIKEIIATMEADAGPCPPPARDLLSGRRKDRGLPRPSPGGGKPKAPSPSPAASREKVPPRR